MITAKVLLRDTTEGTSGPDYPYVILNFGPDYTDGRNQEWALATPGLSLSMTVRPDVAERFETGKAYTLQFAEEA